MNTIKFLTVAAYEGAYEMPKCASTDVLSLVMDRTDPRFDGVADEMWEVECTGADSATVVAWVNSHVALPAVVERAKEEILAGVTDGSWDAGQVQDFSDLHAFCDANEFGGLCDDEVAGSDNFGSHEEWMDFGNDLQARLDVWIKNGGLEESMTALASAFVDYPNAMLVHGTLTIPWGDDDMIVITKEGTGFMVGVYAGVVWSEGVGSFVAVDLPTIHAVVELVDENLTEITPEGVDWCAWAQQWLLDNDGLYDAVEVEI